MYFDPMWLLFAAPGFLLSLWASFRVKSTFSHYNNVPSRRGLSGAEAAAELIRRRGIQGVRIEETPGFLSDHYDPGARVLRLSPDVYHGRSMASLGVAAHEAGHAIQHASGYTPMKWRAVLVKPTLIGTNLANLLLLLGFATQAAGIVWLGIIGFALGALFAVITLPVEFDASRRAVIALQETGIIQPDEADDAAAVLRAAAMTYVAAAITAVMQLVYWLFRAGLLGSRRED
jgi:Zn-dependent membrane protease YugP